MRTWCVVRRAVHVFQRVLILGIGNQCAAGECCVDTDGRRMCLPVRKVDERCCECAQPHFALCGTTVADGIGCWDVATGPVRGVYLDVCPCDASIDCQSGICVGV